MMLHRGFQRGARSPWRRRSADHRSTHATLPNRINHRRLNPHPSPTRRFVTGTNRSRCSETETRCSTAPGSARSCARRGNTARSSPAAAATASRRCFDGVYGASGRRRRPRRPPRSDAARWNESYRSRTMNPIRSRPPRADRAVTRHPTPPHSTPRPTRSRRR